MVLPLRITLMIAICCIFLPAFCNGQKINFRCVEEYQPNDDSADSIFVQTCFLNQYKFETTRHPDIAGRYIYSEHKVFIFKNRHYLEIANSEVFNGKQNALVKMINGKIQKYFEDFSTDDRTKICFTGIDSVPIYAMDDFAISFSENEIWFEVNWGLSSACASVNGTIVSFTIDEI